MLYLRDVWVNWFEGEENGYNVCEFHEWRKEDFIELLDQVPIIKMETTLLNYIENDLSELPNQLLEEVKNKSYIRKNNQREQIEYCFIATDGRKCMIVDTMGYKIPIRKSRMIPRQEQLVYEMAEELDPKRYSFETVEQQKKEYHILSPEPHSMHGLTRRERQLKQLLFMALDQMYTGANTAEARYWYTEWFPEKYSTIQQMSFDEAWRALYIEVCHGWTSKHQSICERLIKGQPYFEKIWELEKGTHVN
ncbi:YjbA family protein [Pseudalkalibacillus berkeleyi]|uniref:YjbA family protein n=1 Tax=Pseudalkalibacillus berkeleyi TaxID=1069813 RepID=A0ABS9GZ03_9BACL|nr:YjbA family protein [Pseudalkalibacillus berkeleyi]MCF6136835.1 YjbA family protein [Pseudalkalibacillus berkeleyi]